MTYHQRYYQQHKAEMDRRTKDYLKSFQGKLMRLYLGAQQRVRGQDKHRPSYKGLPICSIEEFYQFAAESNYPALYEDWKNANYSLRLTPTIDRLDKTKGYTLDNIEIVTLSVNVKRRNKCPI